MAEMLRGLVGDELEKRSEPWARKFFDLGTGRAYEDVVATLAQVGAGVERDSVGNPLSDEAFREQLAAWLVDTVLVNPNLPKNTYRPQFQTAIRVQFDARGEPSPGARVLDTLAELALGAYEETHPRAARIGAPDRVIAAYLRGAEEVAVLAVEPAPVAPAAMARAAALARPAATRPASTRAATRTKPAARSGPRKPATKRAAKPEARKSVARNKPPTPEKKAATKKTKAVANKKAIRKKAISKKKAPAKRKAQSRKTAARGRTVKVRKRARTAKPSARRRARAAAKGRRKKK